MISMTDWLGGFLTGVNATQTGIDRENGATLSFETLQAVLYKYCREHPLDLLFQASTQIYFELKKRQFGK